MGLPYKAKGYIETFNLALEKQCRTKHMNRTIIGGKKKKRYKTRSYAMRFNKSADIFLYIFK